MNSSHLENVQKVREGVETSGNVVKSLQTAHIEQIEENVVKSLQTAQIEDNVVKSLHIEQIEQNVCNKHEWVYDFTYFSECGRAKAKCQLCSKER